MGTIGQFGLGMAILFIGTMLIRLLEAESIVSNKEGAAMFIAMAIVTLLIIWS